jgi:lipopolysaccharide export LptBFGC system permease protein LptF
MTAVLEQLRGSAVRPRRNARLAFFGLYTRYTFQVYVQHIFVVLAGLLIAALTIDVSTQVRELLAASPAATGFDIPLRLAWYALLRCTDIATRLLPIGCFLGVLSAEVAMTVGRERLMISNTGRSPFQCVVPAVLLGIMFGGVQFTLDAFLRPMAMMAQISGRLGDDGRRADRTIDRGQRWFASKDALVRARIEYGPSPVLRDLTVFATGDDGQLRKVLTAASASPEPGTSFWLIKDGRLWVADGTGSRGFTVEVSPQTGEARADLGMDPLWVSYLDISPAYLPQVVLHSLAGSPGGVFDARIYRMMIQVRYADWFLPGSMILLASALSLFFLRHGSSFQRVIMLALIGYVVHVALRAINLLGGYGYVSPGIVAWSIPCVLIAVATTVLTLTYALGTGEGISGLLRKLFGGLPGRSYP